MGQLRALVGPRLLLVPGCRVVLRREDGHVLLQFRRDLRIWGLPGGCAEPGETHADGAVRELHEEIGLTVAAEDLIPFAFSDNPGTNTISYPNGDRCQFFVLCFELTRWQGEPRINDDESLALDWFAPDSLPLILPSSLDTLVAHQAFRKTGRFQLGSLPSDRSGVDAPAQ